MSEILREFEEHEAHNLRASIRALSAIDAEALEVVDAQGALLQEFSEVYGRNCGYAEANHVIGEFVREHGGGPQQLVEYLNQATFIGSLPGSDGAADAKTAYTEAHSDIASNWLLLRLRRDWLFGLGDLLRLRLTSMIGYLRLQAETVALVIHFSADPRAAGEWLDATPDAGRGFYRSHHAKLLEILNRSKLRHYYDEGSAWALHSRVAGVFPGVRVADNQSPHEIELAYQDFRDPNEVYEQLSYYLCAHVQCARALLTSVPEIATDAELQQKLALAERAAERVRHNAQRRSENRREGLLSL